MSQEFPQKPSELRDPSAEAREAFLDRLSLQKLNLTLGMMFKFIDDHKIKKKLEEDEIAEMKRDIEHQIKNPQPGIAPPYPDALREFRKQTLAGLYAPNVLSNILTLQAESENRSLTPYETSDIADYTQFYDIFTNHPELRVRLLEKMLTIVYGRPAVSVENRNAFGRFLYEFYGTEEKREGVTECFLSLDAQTDLLEAWNNVDHWDVAKEQFTDIRRQIPNIREQARRYADQPFIASVITPRLGDVPKDSKQWPGPMTGAARTFSALTAVAESLRGEIDGFLGKRHAPYRIELLAGTSYQPGLDIGFVDFNSRGGRLSSNPPELRTPEYRRSDFRGLATFAMSPRWVEEVRRGNAKGVVLNNFDIINNYDGEERGGDFTLAVGLNRSGGDDPYSSNHGYYIVSRVFADLRHTFAEDLD